MDNFSNINGCIKFVYFVVVEKFVVIWDWLMIYMNCFVCGVVVRVKNVILV